MRQRKEVAPNRIDEAAVRAIALWDQNEEKIEKEGDTYIIKGIDLDGHEYEIPVRTKYTFGAMAVRYCIMLKGEPDVTDPMTRRTIPGDNRKAQFSDSRYVTRDMFEVRSLYLSNAFRHGRIWDVDTENVKAREVNYNAMKTILMGDPEFKERFLEEMRENMKPEEPAKEPQETKSFGKGSRSKG